MSDRRRGSIRQAPAAGSHEPAGPHLGPIPITATGVLLLVALVGSLVFFAYTITVRESTQIPLVVSGSVVLGLVFAAIAAVAARATWRSSVQGRDARAFGHSLLGGIAALIAAACFAGAIVLTLIKG